MRQTSSLKKAKYLVFGATCVAGLTTISSLVATQPIGMVMIALLMTAVLFTSSLLILKVEKEIQKISDVAMRIAGGDLEARIIPINEAGELGGLQKSVNLLLDITDAFVREAEASLAHVSRGKFFRRIVLRGIPGSFNRAARSINDAVAYMGARDEKIQGMADDFDRNIKEVVEIIAAASTELEATAGEMSGSAGNMLTDTQTMQESSEAASQNVQAVAAATEEMSASVEEINRSVTMSSDVARRAVEAGQTASRNINDLNAFATEIGDVINLITDIADQTNLLALNATIEAARAGEAGKGFAVVASEVKSLANQTAQATEDISRQVSGMQGATREAVKDVSEISSVISEVMELSTLIAAAVEEQSVATDEIAQNVHRAADETGMVSQRVNAVTDSSNAMGSSADQVHDASAELSRQANTLQTGVSEFFSTLRSA